MKKVSPRPALRLGDLQLRILKILWDRRAATVADVHQRLAGSQQFAYTTIATMLRKMESRGLVEHHNEGRTFVYQAKVKAGDVTRSMANHLLDRLFEGSLTEAVSHLLTTREVSREELNQLERLISERKRQL